MSWKLIQMPVERIRIAALYGLAIAVWVSVASAVPTVASADQGERGLGVRTTEGEQVGWYAKSYALVIGISDYTAGWSDLESVPSEVESVAAALEEHGFVVEKHLDLDAKSLKGRFDDFVNQYGFGAENRLLFFFAGHGHTRGNGEKGYVVPTDAPDPLADDIAFARKALTMDQILTWARQIESKHALFVFDSCFSGSVFKVRSGFDQPLHISELTSQPVRQFITAGSAEETVPARSAFTPAFIDAIRFGLADLDRDGYVTGTELGFYLRTKVTDHAEQTPQFGTISDYDLSRGDFTFEVTHPVDEIDLPVLTGATRSFVANSSLPLEFAGRHEFAKKKVAETEGEVLDGEPARVVGRFKLESRAMFGIKAFVLIRLKDQDGHTLQVVKARTWVDGRIGTGRKGHVVTFDEEVYDNVRPQIATVELEFVKEE